MQRQGVFVRINGVRPDTSRFVSESSQEGANTSCSIFDVQQDRFFHLLVDVGNGVLASVQQGIAELGITQMPDAVLITHAHKDHINDLPALISAMSGKNFKIYCTRECLDQIMKEFPSIAGQQHDNMFTIVQPGQDFETGSFSVVPVLADHTSDDLGSAPGSVIYVIRTRNVKIVTGWDFISLPNADQNLMWNPDLLILGTETYNDHPSTGMISISQAYNIVRRWNAKECYIVHYSGQKDIEDARNQWFRGPTRPLSPDDLQKIIDEHLRVSGGEGKFRIKVARQGMVWEAAEKEKAKEEGPIGKKIEIEALEKYVLNIEKVDEGNKLNVSIEDSIHRLSSEFANPRKGREGGDVILQAEPITSFMMKGPELKMSLIPQGEESLVRVNITKGKRAVFADDIRISNDDAQKLSRYVKENFATAA